MKIKIVAVVLVIILASISFFAKSDVDRAVQPASNQLGKVQGLDAFKQGGVEYKIDMHNVSPQDFVEASKKYLGMVHCMGGDGTSGCIDCSGLLLATFKGVNINIGIHNSQEMARYGTIINDKNRLHKGDLVFFVGTYQTDKVITHSGIMVDDKNWIHTSSKNGVEIIPLDHPHYWNKHYLYGTRIFL
ncbi:MAG: NlpC/P60 family protein [Gallionellaceae bacterium]